jgi:poly-gamma-glutamate synthase PgsB/CapB
MSVLSRTTGAKPVLKLPDGSEKEIVRRGPATILEGKKIFQAVSKFPLDACVVELMGIQPETLYVESQKIFKPHILVVTNARLDHMEQMGQTKDRIASCFASAIPQQGTIFVPQEELYPIFHRTADSKRARLLTVPENAYSAYTDKKNGILSSEFETNVRLSLTVTDFIGLDTSSAFRAMSEALPDFGRLKVWTELRHPSPPDWYFVSGFAANEPESTQMILSRLRDNQLMEGRTVIVVLNLRGDRGDRTLQWVEAFRSGKFSLVKHLICVGDHRMAFTRKLKKYAEADLYAWRDYPPEEMLARLSAITKKKAVVIGMGNMAGTGKRLVDYWEKTGTQYDL